jgi:hypothetical protein
MSNGKAGGYLYKNSSVQTLSMHNFPPDRVTH